MYKKMMLRITSLLLPVVTGFGASIVSIDSYQRRYNQKTIQALSADANSKTFVIIQERKTLQMDTDSFLKEVE